MDRAEMILSTKKEFLEAKQIFLYQKTSEKFEKQVSFATFSIFFPEN